MSILMISGSRESWFSDAMVTLDGLKMNDEVRGCLGEEEPAKHGAHWRFREGGLGAVRLNTTLTTAAITRTEQQNNYEIPRDGR